MYGVLDAGSYNSSLGRHLLAIITTHDSWSQSWSSTTKMTKDGVFSRLNGED
ncbi:hypothetical protein PHLCEN_2v6609 [Hermanssonia centrifuga]|uniref:Uncharacterized protein n=1 Tax=Hermanssonia centrifuga TaxID=98765 RepID=A0A2R6NYT3_9APHY|nr:hypothetical protein PHLCEN_2v6609 [Hermanssonia centrifuga]